MKVKSILTLCILTAGLPTVFHSYSDDKDKPDPVTPDPVKGHLSSVSPVQTLTLSGAIKYDEENPKQRKIRAIIHSKKQ
ncbi:MAG: hypothetical protein LBG28_16140 [Tannerella sp.]|jgi:hypothetical protein|nr:hypothetical protein [Tannerella sp.]